MREEFHIASEWISSIGPAAGIDAAMDAVKKVLRAQLKSAIGGSSVDIAVC